MIDELPNLIRARRQEMGLSQKQLAEAARVSRTTLSHVEQGKAPHVQMDVLARIMHTLDLAPRLSTGGSPDFGRLAARLAHRERLHAQRERHLRLAVELAADSRAARGRIARAREAVELWRRKRSCSPHYIRRWTELLSLPPAQLARRMASLGEWEDAMFQNTPWSWAWT
jgi:transcriptional regulator with XRE-family HTH domain